MGIPIFRGSNIEDKRHFRLKHFTTAAREWQPITKDKESRNWYDYNLYLWSVFIEIHEFTLTKLSMTPVREVRFLLSYGGNPTKIESRTSYYIIEEYNFSIKMIDPFKKLNFPLRFSISVPFLLLFRERDLFLNLVILEAWAALK